MWLLRDEGRASRGGGYLVLCSEIRRLVTTHFVSSAHDCRV